MTYTSQQKNKIKFSFIVPVYNVDKYLNKCVDSLLSQTYSNYEIILVDDKSTDSSIELCNKFSKENKNVITIKNDTNYGLAETRNIGLKKATGNWVVFVDSDDYIDDKDFLKTLLKNINDSDVIFYGYTKFNDNNKKIISKKFNEINYINNFEDNIQKINYLYKTKNWCWTAWTHAYSIEFLNKNKLSFNKKLRQAEDCEFFYRMLINNPKISAINFDGYMYRVRDKSLTQDPKNTTKYAVEVTKSTIETILNSNLNNDYKTALYNTLAYNYITTLINIQSNLSKKEIKEQLENLKKYKFINKYGTGIKLKSAQFTIKILGINFGSWLLTKMHKTIRQNEK